MADPCRVFLTLGHIKGQVRQQIHLVQQHQPGVVEHLGVFERLVLPFGHGEHHHLVGLAKIKGSRADQVADVLDKQDIQLIQIKGLSGMHNHMGIQVAAGAGVDLLDRYAGGGDPTGVVIGLLITFDHGTAIVSGQVPQGALQQGGLAGTGGGDQVQHQDAFFPEQCPIKGGQPVVLGQHILFYGDPF